MSDVSFFVTHGAAIWQALTATSLIAGGVAAWKLVDRGMRARAERVREGLGAPAPAPNPNDAGKRVTLAGTLRLEDDDAKRDAIAATVVPRGLELSEEPTPKAKGAVAAGKKLTLDVAGVRVLLDGPIEILVGSRETERCIGRVQGQTLLWDFAGDLGALPQAFGARVLAAGDRVLARGILRYDPRWGQDYREGSATFALDVDRGDAETRTIVLAYEARPRPLARPKTRTLTRALIAPLAVFGALSVIGEACVRIPRAFAWTIATATPFRRSDALGLLRGNVGLGTRADPTKIDSAVALDRLRGRCGDAIDDAFAHQQLAQAGSLARECNDPWREASVHVAAADFPNAAGAYERARKRDERLPYSLSEATAYIVTGKHAKAAAALRGIARTWEDGRAARTRLECAALYEEHRDPKTGDAEPVETLLGNEADGACALLYWDAARKADLERGWYWGQKVTDPRSTMVVMAMERGRPDMDVPTCYAVAADIVFDPRHCLYDVPPAVVASVVKGIEAGPSSPRTELNRAALLLRLARVDSYFGELDEAKNDLIRAREALKGAQGTHTDAELDRLAAADDYRYYRWDVPPVARDDGAVVALRAKSERPNLDEWDLALDVRSAVIPTRHSDDWRSKTLLAAGRAKHGDPTALALLADRDSREANQKPWQLVLSNDDEGFVNRLEDRGLDGRGIVDFLGGSDRPELRRWVRYDYTTACVTCGLYPLANQIVSRRDAAIATHADDVAAEMGAAARRLRDVLYRRDVAIVLSVISELSPP